VKPRSRDSGDIERAVYDGMQDLRAPKSALKRRQKPAQRKKPKKRR
jgi:hypothetical protein